MQSHDGFAGRVKWAASSRGVYRGAGNRQGNDNLARSPVWSAGPPGRASGFASCGAFKIVAIRYRRVLGKRQVRPCEVVDG